MAVERPLPANDVDELRARLAEVEVHLAEQTLRLSRIIETQRDIASADLDLQSIMDLICERTRQLTGAGAGTILMAEPEHLVHVAANGFMADKIGLPVPFESFSGEVYRTSLSARSDDTFTDDRFTDLARSRGIRSIVGVPLTHGDKSVGELQVMSEQPNAFSDEDVKTLELLSVVLSSALSHAAEFEAKRSQVALLARFEAMYRGAVFGIALVDAHGRIVECNPAMSEILRYDEAELVGTALNDYAHPSEVTAHACLFDQLMHGERDAFRVEKRYIAKSGEVVWGHVAASLVQDTQDESRLAIVMIGNISDLKAAEEELRRLAEASQYLALHDPLTGLPNRRLFDDRVAQAIRTAERDGDQLAVMIMDLDRFKKINDTFGHDGGDELLRRVGARLDECLRASDTVARLGGDEFGFLLVTHTDRRELAPLLDKLAAGVELPIEIQGSSVVVHASIGVAFYPLDGTQREQLVKRADAAMYRAKQAGLSYTFFEHDRADVRPG